MNKLDLLSDVLWSYSETGFKETNSADAICQFLQEEGFTIERPIAFMDTAFIASYGSGRPVLAFLAEYDALDGMDQKADELSPCRGNKESANGHGCGHHLLACGVIGAALKYRDYLQSNGKPGTIRLFGCPGEEAGSGKAYLARAHYFDQCDVALSWHPSIYNSIVSGSSQSCISAYFRFKGISSHASSAPQLGRSALDSAELMNVGVNYLREHMENTDRVHYAYINAGSKAPNVVQKETVLKYFIRSRNNDECLALYQRVVNCAKGAALMCDTDVEVIFDEGLSNIISSQVLEQVAEVSLKKLHADNYSEEDLAYCQQYKDLADERVLMGNLPKHLINSAKLIKDIQNNPINTYVVDIAHNDECQDSSSDVGDVSWCIPTVQINTACFAFGSFAHSWQWVAQGKSSVAHKGYQYAADVLADIAQTLNENPDIIEDAKQEHHLKLEGKSYQCLIPEDVEPHIYEF